MNTTILKASLVLAIAFNCSCKKQSKNIQSETQIEIAEKTDELHLSSKNKITLNKGKRWNANPETTEGIKNMKEIMNNFTNKSSLKAYKLLTEHLILEFSMVFEKCTMKGEAHNQLHNFLIPINDLFTHLSSSDLKECQDSYETLNKHLKKYQTYFK
jgi:hypothetical protein